MLIHHENAFFFCWPHSRKGWSRQEEQGAIPSYIEIQDQVKKWRPNSWNVTHSYRWLFSNKFFIFAFFVEISTATPHQHPCRTFVLVFGMTLEIKNLRKTIFEFYQFPVKIILVSLCTEDLYLQRPKRVKDFLGE